MLLSSRFLWSVLCVSLLAPPLRADPSTEKKDEGLLLLYILEHQYANMIRLEDPTLDKNRTEESTGRINLRVLTLDLAQRQRMVDQLCMHIKKRAKDDQKLDPRLFEAYETLKTELLAYKEFADKELQSYNKYCTVVRIQAALGSQLVATTALSYGIQFFLDGEPATLAQGIKKNSGIRDPGPERDNRVAVEAAKVWDAECTASEADLSAWLQTHHRPNLEVAANLSKDFGTRLGLKQAEQPVFSQKPRKQPPAPSIQPLNPFLQMEAARHILLKNQKDVSSAGLLDQARNCMEAVKVFPDDKVYNYFRAALYGQAGLLANRAAAREVGAGGLSGLKKPVEGAGLAVKAWERYLQNEEFDMNRGSGDVLHHYVMAHAYNADLGKACRLLRRWTKPSTPFTSPEYPYNFACLCSREADFRLAMECLLLAKRLGFQDFDKARADVDLEKLRSSIYAAQFNTWAGR